MLGQLLYQPFTLLLQTMRSRGKREIYASVVNLLLLFTIQIASCARSDWSKTHVLSEYKTYGKSGFYCLSLPYLYIIKQIMKPKPDI